MNLEANIARNGQTIYWKKMAGTGGTFNTATRTVENASSSASVAIPIKAVVDGFGTITTMLRSIAFAAQSLRQAGQLRVFTCHAVGMGDILTVDGVNYTVIFGKSIYYHGKIVLYMVEASQ